MTDVHADRGGGGGAVSPSAARYREENAALAPLAVATLRALLLFSPEAFRSHLKDFFPLLTALISCEYAPPEVQVSSAPDCLRRDVQWSCAKYDACCPWHSPRHCLRGLHYAMCRPKQHQTTIFP